MSTRYLHNRRFNASLKNIAVWGYWKEVESYGQGTQRSGAPWFEALTGKSPVNICYFFIHISFLDESGWAWFIPLHNGSTSVGIVVSQKVYNATAGSTVALPARYLASLNLAPGVVKLIGKGMLVAGSVKSASDFSYSAPFYAGPNYRIVGDAGGQRFSCGIPPHTHTDT